MFDSAAPLGEHPAADGVPPVGDVGAPGERGWDVVPGSGWTVEQVEALIWAGMPVVRVGEDGRRLAGGDDTEGAPDDGDVLGWDGDPVGSSRTSTAGDERLHHDSDGDHSDAGRCEPHNGDDTVRDVQRDGDDDVSRDGDDTVQCDGERTGGRLDPAGSWLGGVADAHLGPISWLGERAPGGALLIDLESLPQPWVDDDYDAVEVVGMWASLEAYCAAGKRRAAAALARREVMASGLAGLERHGFTVEDPNIASDEISLRLGISRRAAKRLIRAGQVMNGIGIPTAEALTAGRISAPTADLILEAVADLGPEAGLAVQDRVLPKAAHLGPGRLRRELAAACAAVDPEEFEDRCAQAAQTRRVDRPRPLPHGMASLYAVLPAVEATSIYRVLDAAARSAKTCAHENRTMDQLRADALALLAMTALDTGWIGTPPPEPAAATSDGDGDGDGNSRAGRKGRIRRRGHRGADSRHDKHDPADSNRGRQGRPDEVNRPARLRRMRIGQIGGMSAHVKVVVPYTILMDHPPGDRAAGQPPGNDHDDPQQPAERVVQRGGDDGMPTGRHGRAGRPPDEEDRIHRDDGARVRDHPAGDIGHGDQDGACGDLRADASGVTRVTGLPARQVPVPDALTIAELEGYGPIPAAAARALAAGSVWSRLVLDPIDRTILEASPATYRPPAAMARLVRAAQPYCAQPSCGVASDTADLNHRIPWPIGATSIWSLDPECRRDHLLHTHGGWHYEQDDATGSRTWTTATGHTYTHTIDDVVTMHSKGGTPRSWPPGPDRPPPF